ncbi:MAG: tRNA uridine-5-carboxymethylaminomethyl(34) synthesis GTPase MnmE [Alphaproteobacteria bacterium]|jgi:tRNA modification GTPase|tara:strand:- start:1191 stop:2510 length:1320 start_codon:yes stop_codon:yes gene_type:complete
MQKENYNSTIYALSSAEGKAGVSVIRISGNKSSEVINKLGGTTSYPRVAKITKLVDPDNGEIVDKAIAIWFPGPNSFTGEDTVELFVHGGRAVIDKIFDILARLNGLSFAEPGEFTKRSFMNGKLDLTSVEGLADLINADTELQRKQALAQMEGSLFKLYDNWRTMLIKSLSYIEANIDFIEEDLPKNILEKEMLFVSVTLDQINKHLSDGKKGERLRDGYRVVLAGAPNTGKSSLLNLLSNRDVAIVSSEPGTTRDIIDVYLDINGCPVIISDTAGIRDSDSNIEQQGIDRAKSRIAESDLVLWLKDSSLKENIAYPYSSDNNIIEVWTKSDITVVERNQPFISVHNNTGIEDLIDLIGKNALNGCATEDSFITRARHRDSLIKISNSLTNALQIDLDNIEIIAEELRSACNVLGKITGRVDVEDLLEVIFSDFCIGK